MLTVLGKTRHACEGLRLRLPEVLAAKWARPGPGGRARSVVFLFVFGSPG